jgi:hypothetical protein
MGAVVVALGVGILLDSANVVDVSVRTLLSICLLITGAGLLVGTWWGRGRWLVFPGMLLVVALLGINFASVHGMDGRRQREFNFRVGNQSFTPTTPQDLQSEYRILGGEMTLDLSGLDLQGQRPRVEAGLGFGQLSVVVPPDTGLRIEARVGAGEIDLLGKHDDGMGIVSTHRTDPTDRGLLTLRLSVGTGQISVREGVQPFQPLIPSPPPAFTDAPPAPEGTP